MLLATALLFVLFAAQAATTTTPQGDPPAAQAAPQAPAPSTPPNRRIGGYVTAPIVLHKVDPEFSKEERKSGIFGVTLVSLIVDAQGNPQNVQVSRSIADTVNKKQRALALTLDEKAVDAVKRYKFAPATQSGKPVAVKLLVEINFQIR